MRTLLFAVLVALGISLSYQAYSHSLAVEFARVSAISYCTMESITSWTCGPNCDALKGKVTWLRYYNKPTPQGDISYSMYVDTTNHYLIVAFRGTNSNWQLLLEVCEGHDVDYTLHSIPKAVVTDYFYQHYVNDLRMDFLNYLQKFRQSYPTYQVVFTGHSLGGALTTHAALDAVLSGFVPSNLAMVYNFGSPRVGNYAFASKVKEVIPNFYRVTHNKDLVPHVPPCRIGLSGQCITGEGNIDYTLNYSPIWYAWHVAGEIHYNADSSSYITCYGGEDPNCADQYLAVTCGVSDHLNYVGINLGQAGCAPNAYHS